MKKTLLLLSLIISATVLHAQQKSHLPDTCKIKLTPVQIQTLYGKIDSLQTLLSATSTLPSNDIQSFNQRVNLALQPINKQLNDQLIADKPKEKPIK